MPDDTFQHLMFAQDTGSAIRGAARADIYFGHGEDIPHIAGRIKQFGKFVMLVPKDVAVRRRRTPETDRGIPLPRPRPQDLVARTIEAITHVGAAQARKRMSSRGSRRRVLSHDERVLWTTFTRSIEPLHASALSTPDADAEPAADRQTAARRPRRPSEHRRRRRRQSPRRRRWRRSAAACARASRAARRRSTPASICMG